MSRKEGRIEGCVVKSMCYEGGRLTGEVRNVNLTRYEN
jgi:hypothetical protein